MTKEPRFKTKGDVLIFIYNHRCGGCEHSITDELGESPNPYNEICHDCEDWSRLYRKIDNMTLEDAIRTYTPGNDT